MRISVVLVLASLAGCQLYFGGGDDDAIRFHRPDAATDIDGGRAPDAMPADCYNLGCQPNYHTEPQCEPPGSNGCATHCHCACVPDESCATVDCGASGTCVQTCTRECSSMAIHCDQRCVASGSEPTCERHTTEASCVAEPGCVPVYRGTGCACFNLACSCMDDQAAFARCEAAAPP